MPIELDYPIHTKRLSNGLRVVVNPDHTAPIVAVNIWYDVGSKDELPGQTGLAHLFEHLMFQGSANVASGDHLHIIQSHGGTVNATTSFDRTNYFETVPVGALKLALWLEADRLGTLPAALTQENLDNQRDVVKEEKRQRYDNQPYGDLLEHLTSLTFPPEHPYGHTTIGSMADLDAASLTDVHDFFARWYVPANAVLTLVGDIEPDRAFAKANEFFGHLKPSELPARQTPELLPQFTGAPRKQVSADVPSSALYFTWRLPARETPAMDALELALDILGGSETSRLHRAIVRGKELSTGAGASGIALIGGTSLGFAYARALDGTPLPDIEAAMTDALERLADEGPTEAELARSQIQLERVWLEECADFASRADLINTFATLHGEPEMINTRLEQMWRIQASDVQEATRTYLAPQHRAVLEYHRTEGQR